jgi:hypothetical protein
MTEAFLFHAWLCRLFNNDQLQTTEGDPLRVIHPGLLNTDAGPDFMNARIRIGETLWAGNVEIHIKASDWKKHRHQHDPSYSNIILHVVFEADEPVTRPDGSNIPVLVLKDKINAEAWRNYQYLLSNKAWIPCAGRIGEVPGAIIEMQLSRMVTERLERKTQEILNDLRVTRQNWEEVFYRMMARNFGFKVNAVPFEMLARAIPETILARHKSNLLQTESLLFGAAGMLCGPTDEYSSRLTEEFSFLKNKFSLKSIDEHLWKFLRLRPANFPTIRIAQFGSLMTKHHHLFSNVLEKNTVSELVSLLSVGVSPYWESHFLFGHPSPSKPKHLGLLSIQNIIVNTIIPFLFLYGNQKRLPQYRERAFYFLEQLPAEKNTIVSSWNDYDVKAETASQSQGLIELKNNYCDAKKCLQCSIGNNLLRS